MASPMTPIPKKIMPRPRRIMPWCLTRARREKKRMAKPTSDQKEGVLFHLEGDDLSRDGRADVGTHDHTDGLDHGHEAGRDEPHQEHGGHRRRLNHSRDQGTGERGGESIGGEAGKEGLHPAPCHHLQGLGQLIHSEKEEGEAPEEAHQKRKELKLSSVGHQSPLVEQDVG